MKARGSTVHITGVKWNSRWKAQHLILGHRIAYFLIIFAPLLERVHFSVLTPSHPLRKTKYLARWMQASGRSCGLGKNRLDDWKIWKKLFLLFSGPVRVPVWAACTTCSAAPCCHPGFCALGVMRGCRYFPNHKHQIQSRVKTKPGSHWRACVRLV